MDEICPRREPLGYLGWHFKAARLHKAGTKQALCKTCGRWKFPDERCEQFQTVPSSWKRCADSALLPELVSGAEL